MLEAKILDDLLKDILEKIEDSKEKIYDVAENARQECQRVEKVMREIKENTLAIVEDVDKWEREKNIARQRLAEVSSNFDKFKEEDIKYAYTVALDIQVKLALLEEKEKQYKTRRLEMEQQYLKMQQIAEKAETLVSQVGVVMSYLGSNLQNIQDEVSRARDWKEVGLAVIKAQENERRRIARGIHDGPAQSLANIVLRIEYCQKVLAKQPPLLDEELLQLKTFARSTLKEIREILFDLRPANLEDFGLTDALKRYFMDYQQKHGIIITPIFSGKNQSYIPEVEIAVYRIIQECLNNAAKHSQCSNITVQMEISATFLRVVVTDDGTGFDVREGFAKNRFGLSGMQEWARLLGGEVKVNSTPNKGTRVFVTLPLEER